MVDDALMGGEEEGLKRHSAVDCHLQVGEGVEETLGSIPFYLSNSQIVSKKEASRCLWIGLVHPLQV